MPAYHPADRRRFLKTAAASAIAAPALLTAAVPLGLILYLLFLLKSALRGRRTVRAIDAELSATEDALINAMIGAGMAAQAEPGLTTPYDGLGDQAIAVGPADTVLQAAMASAERVFELLDEAEESAEPSEPTIVRAQPGHRVAREEVFGPFVTVLTFRDDEEALRIANSTDYGLGAGLWIQNPYRSLG